MARSKEFEESVVLDKAMRLFGNKVMRRRL